MEKVNESVDFNFSYDLCLISHVAVDFFLKNKHRLKDVNLNEYSAHAIALIDEMIRKGHVDGDLEIATEMIIINRAATKAKDNILRARNTVEDNPEKTKTATLDGGFWWFYKQVIIYTMDKASIIDSKHKKNRPTLEVYNHIVDVEFLLDGNHWLYKTEIKEDDTIKTTGFINNIPMPHKLNIRSIDGGVCFLLYKVADTIAMDKAVKYTTYMNNDSPAAKRAKAVASLLNGDFKDKDYKNTSFDQLKLSE